MRFFINSYRRYICLLFLIVLILSCYISFNYTYAYVEHKDISFLSDNINKMNSLFEIDTDNPYALDIIVDDDGNVPASSYYTHIPSRSIKELRVYNDKLFMGIGDWGANTGPVKILYYDFVTGDIKDSGTINDEAVESFNIIDGKLYTTGTDPRDDWGYGSYYVYNDVNDSWDQYRLNNGWVHVFDITEYHGNLFMCGATVDTTKRTPIQISYDNGITFEDVTIIKDGVLLPYNSDLRFYRFEKYNGTLYAYSYSSVNNFGYCGIYRYDEDKNQFVFVTPFGYSPSEYGLYESIRYNLLHFKNNTVFNDYFVYVSGNFLYKTTDMMNFKRIETNTFDVVQDVVVHGDTLYTLSYRYNEDKTFDTRIYSTKDLENFQLLYEFNIDTLPFSIEYYDNNIYIGTNYHEDSKDYNDYNSLIKNYSETGSLYKIDLDSIYKNITLDEDNNVININANNIMYSVNYDFSYDSYIFDVVLSFDNNMSDIEMKQEFTKFENLYLMYSLLDDINQIDLESSRIYFNNILKGYIDLSLYDGYNVLEFVNNLFSDGLNILDDRFSITANDILVNDNEYIVMLSLKVFGDENLVIDSDISVDDNYFLNISENTTVGDILNKIDTNGHIVVFNGFGDIDSYESFISTGSRIIIEFSRNTYEYTVIIYGDVDGDGKLKLSDVMKIASYLYKDKDSLNGVYLLAADYDKDNSYDLQDLMKIAKKIYNN